MKYFIHYFSLISPFFSITNYITNTLFEFIIIQVDKLQIYLNYFLLNIIFIIFLILVVLILYLDYLVINYNL